MTTRTPDSRRGQGHCGLLRDLGRESESGEPAESLPRWEASPTVDAGRPSIARIGMPDDLREVATVGTMRVVRLLLIKS